MANTKHKCCICGREFEGWGNDPAPLKNKGVCCDDCNSKVILARLSAMRNMENMKRKGEVR